jgi:hypothetical protein
VRYDWDPEKDDANRRKQRHCPAEISIFLNDIANYRNQKVCWAILTDEQRGFSRRNILESPCAASAEFPE